MSCGGCGRRQWSAYELPGTSGAIPATLRPTHMANGQSRQRTNTAGRSNLMARGQPRAHAWRKWQGRRYGASPRMGVHAAGTSWGAWARPVSGRPHSARGARGQNKWHRRRGMDGSTVPHVPEPPTSARRPRRPALNCTPSSRPPTTARSPLGPRPRREGRGACRGTAATERRVLRHHQKPVPTRTLPSPRPTAHHIVQAGPPARPWSCGAATTKREEAKGTTASGKRGSGGTYARMHVPASLFARASTLSCSVARGGPRTATHGGRPLWRRMVRVGLAEGRSSAPCGTARAGASRR